LKGKSIFERAEEGRSAQGRKSAGQRKEREIGAACSDRAVFPSMQINFRVEILANEISPWAKILANFALRTGTEGVCYFPLSKMLG
jgi:hypothetical protein